MLGDSAGRSGGNPAGEGARRRFTPRERDRVDPPLDRLEPIPGSRVARRSFSPLPLTARGRRVADALAFMVMVAFGCFGAILIAAWWGLI